MATSSAEAKKTISPTDKDENGVLPAQELRYGWSAGRERRSTGEKQQMAEDYVEHDFLVKPGNNPELHSRETAASVVVTPGTTPDTVVNVALEWMRREWSQRGPFSIIWYTPGARVAGSLRAFRDEYQNFRSAADVFLFPGPVDPDVESVVGNVPVQFVNDLKTKFTYSVLSAYSFDMATGQAYFHYSTEIALQHACARLGARQKFLFLDASKFQSEGEPAYTIEDLLETSQEVTIYTVASDHDDNIKEQFNNLRSRLLDDKGADGLNAKQLRLRIVGRNGKPTDNSPYRGHRS